MSHRSTVNNADSSAINRYLFYGQLLDYMSNNIRTTVADSQVGVLAYPNEGVRKREARSAFARQVAMLLTEATGERARGGEKLYIVASGVSCDAFGLW